MATRLLLIDDNPPDRVRYRRMLQRDADGTFDIVEAEDGTRGLTALGTAEPPFDCVLLDQDLPDLQGLDVLDDIRALPSPPPVVMLTGEEDAAVSIDALRRGAADYLMKRRIDEDRLHRAVRGAIERHRLAAQLRAQEQRLTRFYKLANQTGDALFIVEMTTLTITDCNEAAAKSLGIAPATPAAAVPAAFADHEAWRAFCMEAQREGSARQEWQTPTADGGVASMEILARGIEADGERYIVAVGRDISLRKQRERELLERSLRDGLTGVWNRRAFDERLAECWREAVRKGRPLAVVMIDVDHFKFYNDGLGHPAGDECLRRVAAALQGGVLRGAAMLARYGGEEFVALLEDTDAEGALAAAERLRQAVLALALPHPRSSVGPLVTASLGAASRVPTDGPPQALLDAADAALYQAKRQGRDRCVVATR